MLKRQNMQVKALTQFYMAISDDHRISPSHIAVYMALFQCWNQHDFQNPVHVTRRQIMAAAKIGGLGTYHRCMRELHQFGYIHYEPSFNPAVKSQVCLLSPLPGGAAKTEQTMQKGYCIGNGKPR